MNKLISMFLIAIALVFAGCSGNTEYISQYDIVAENSYVDCDLILQAYDDSQQNMGGAGGAAYLSDMPTSITGSVQSDITDSFDVPSVNDPPTIYPSLVLNAYQTCLDNEVTLDKGFAALQHYAFVQLDGFNIPVGNDCEQIITSGSSGFSVSGSTALQFPENGIYEINAEASLSFTNTVTGNLASLRVEKNSSIVLDSQNETRAGDNNHIMNMGVVAIVTIDDYQNDYINFQANFASAEYEINGHATIRQILSD